MNLLKRHLLLSGVNVFLLTGLSFAQPGNPDPTFSSDGVVHSTLYEGLSSIASNVLILEDGKILTTGGSRVPDDSYVGLLQRFLPDGSEDLEFNETGSVTLTLPGQSCYGINSIQQPDGKILTLGGVNANTETIITLFRHNLDGSPDEGYGTDGRVLINPGFTELAPRYMVRQPDGKLVICGYAKEQDDPFYKFIVVRCLIDGSLDNSFGDNGFVTTTVGAGNGKAESLCLQGDGKIVVAGIGVFNGKDNIVVARYLPDGTPDHTFDQDGIVNIAFQQDNFRGLRTLIQPDGKIVVSGSIRAPNADTDFVAIRINANGNPDTSFNEDGIARLTISEYADEARAMTIQLDEKIVLAGYAHSNSPEGSNSALIRLTQDGYPDPTFGEEGIFEWDHHTHENLLLGMVSQPDGKIVAVGRCIVGDFSKCLIARFFSGLTVSTTEPSPLFTAVTVYPNPVIKELTIEYQLEQEETISIRLVDLHGHLIGNLLSSAHRQPGQHKETFPIDEGLSTGTYIVQMTNRKGMIAHKIMKTRTDG
jgi:uncharacterized delta-60 repeat protein